jgi:hypothetical protein
MRSNVHFSSALRRTVTERSAAHCRSLARPCACASVGRRFRRARKTKQHAPTRAPANLLVESHSLQCVDRGCHSTVTEAFGQRELVLVVVRYICSILGAPFVVKHSAGLVQHPLLEVRSDKKQGTASGAHLDTWDLKRASSNTNDIALLPSAFGFRFANSETAPRTMRRGSLWQRSSRPGLAEQEASSNTSDSEHVSLLVGLCFLLLVLLVTSLGGSGSLLGSHWNRKFKQQWQGMSRVPLQAAFFAAWASSCFAAAAAFSSAI